MIAYAAIDIREGRVVQLVGGRLEAEAITQHDPVASAQHWLDCGFAGLHVVDLDAAFGHGDNRRVIDQIIELADVPVHVGGGIRDAARVQQLIDAGASKVVVGTRAVEDADWRRTISQLYPGRVIVAADMRDGRVVTRAWQETTSYDGKDFVTELGSEPLAGILVTDVTREGRMSGVNGQLFTELAGQSQHPIIASGGIRDAADLQILAEAGVSGAVLGMSLYSGAIDPATIAPAYAI